MPAPWWMVPRCDDLLSSKVPWTVQAWRRGERVACETASVVVSGVEGPAVASVRNRSFTWLTFALAGFGRGRAVADLAA